jgi:transposase InsO family protein
MPWKEVTVVEKRAEFVLLASKEGSNMSALCQRFGISRKTGYKWLNRHIEGGMETLQDRSRRPAHSPRRTPAAAEEAVLSVRQAHPAWGGRKIAHVLDRDRQLRLAPSTVTHILHRYGQIDPVASEAATPWQRFEHEQPNSLWQMDFKGHFAVGNGRCHPLTVIDDHSRYNVVLAACGNEQRSTVQSVLERVFAQYGLPQRINADNGPPWGTAGQEALSGLAVWLIRLGVRLSHSRPLHPQTNGKDERFHRSFKAEVLAHRHFENLAQTQNEFDRWRWVYNRERPHEALSMQTPAQRYSPSPRSLPASLPPIEYGPDDSVRKVQQGGWISFQGRDVRLSKALVGQPVALRPCLEAEGSFKIYFCHQLLLTLNLREYDVI